MVKPWWSPGSLGPEWCLWESERRSSTWRAQMNWEDLVVKRRRRKTRGPVDLEKVSSLGSTSRQAKVGETARTDRVFQLLPVVGCRRFVLLS